MLKKIFGTLFKNRRNKTESSDSDNYLVITLNDKIMPIDRGEVYEDPLDSFLKQMNYGEVTGGGTSQHETGEIEYCDIEVSLYPKRIDNETIQQVINKLEELGAPKGSSVFVEKTGQKIPFGIKEGLAIYLDGINLSDEVYKNSDSVAIATEIRRLANIQSEVLRYWEGNSETALYFYDSSFEQIRKSIEDFVMGHPECENARIVQIA
jgi:hypothetical protein